MKGWSRQNFILSYSAVIVTYIIVLKSETFTNILKWNKYIRFLIPLNNCKVVLCREGVWLTPPQLHSSVLYDCYKSG